MRPVLVQRIYDAIVASESSLKREAIESVNWVTNEILPPTQDRYSEDEILKQIHNKSEPVVNRNRPSYIVSWIRRTLQEQPIILSGLHVNQTSMLHLPAESFVEYQLEAQQFATSRFVACAAYGDGGPWYIPTEEAYPQGGYEVSVAWCTPVVDPILTAGVQALLKG